MKNRLVVTLIAAFFVTGCTIGFEGDGAGGLVIAPALPVIVQLDVDHSYYQNGYYYSRRGNSWYYSQSRDGSWSRLPRDRYPMEVHYQGQVNHRHYR
jgi:hypothetical protein